VDFCSKFPKNDGQLAGTFNVPAAETDRFFGNLPRKNRISGAEMFRLFHVKFKGKQKENGKIFLCSFVYTKFFHLSLSVPLFLCPKC